MDNLKDAANKKAKEKKRENTKKTFGTKKYLPDWLQSSIRKKVDKAVKK